MRSKSLAEDYLSRSEKRLKAIDTLFQEEAWADVVRESQEVVELSSMGLLRSWNIEVPRIHDVSNILEENLDKCSKKFHSDVKEFCKISHELRRVWL